MLLLRYEGPEHIFNVSSGKGHSVIEVVEMLATVLGFLPQVTHAPDRGFDVAANVLDSSRLLAETGWWPEVPMAEGINRTVAWIRSRLAHEACELHL